MQVHIDDDFPRQWAETDRLTRGLPRGYAITDAHVTFLRAEGPTDVVLSLWRFDVTTGTEQRLVDARALTGEGSELPPEERARRERMRESGGGITAYSMSADGSRIAFAANGLLWLWDAQGLRSVALPAAPVDPRIDPTGDLVACVVDGGVTVVRFVDGDVVADVRREGRTVGLADFAAAEELRRHRGHWWSPAGDALIVEVVDDRMVPEWFITDPTHPEQPPRSHRYPHAGAANAHCSLLLIDLMGGTEIGLDWEALEFEYLVDVHWSAHGAALVTLANRLQTVFETFTVDTATGTLTSLHRAECEPWIDVTVGVPAWLPGGRLLHAVNDVTEDTRRLAIDATFITPPGFQVAAVLSSGERGVVALGGYDERTQEALHVALDHPDEAFIGDNEAWNAIASNGRIHVVQAYTTDGGVHVDVLREDEHIGSIGTRSANVTLPTPLDFEVMGPLGCNALVFWPQHAPAGPLPIIMAPYGGPHHREVLAAGRTLANLQWLADQGFAVIVADGRGTPGRGLLWEHSIHHRVAETTLADQVAVLDAALERWPDRLDGTRVGIRGWSYGGYLAALAVLQRPDRFHAAVAGAPVTDWRLYDTAYTERYLGLPTENGEVYEQHSLLPLAERLSGELLIVHGLADDNVVAAHSLQLSAALYAAGKPHTFLPLAGVSHMTPQPRIKENLLRLEADFFVRHLRG